jgi:hypothetical protein
MYSILRFDTYSIELYRHYLQYWNGQLKSVQEKLGEVLHARVNLIFPTEKADDYLSLPRDASLGTWAENSDDLVKELRRYKEPMLKRRHGLDDESDGIQSPDHQSLRKKSRKDDKTPWPDLSKGKSNYLGYLVKSSLILQDFYLYLLSVTN